MTWQLSIIFRSVLRGDAPSLGFIDELLHELFRNVWLSDGRTLGKLHFDQYDNLLVMVCSADGCHNFIF